MTDQSQKDALKGQKGSKGMKGEEGAPGSDANAGDGQINVNAGNGLSVTGSNATANQTGNTTRTLSVKLKGTSLAVDANGLSVNQVDWTAITNTPTSYPPSSHSHTFNSLTSKSSGTGNYETTGYFVAGQDGGEVALTTNDGQGNANVTFNHTDGIPDQDGTSGRITVNTDTSGTTGYMNFSLKNSVKKGVATSLTERLKIAGDGTKLWVLLLLGTLKVMQIPQQLRLAQVVRLLQAQQMKL